jgi:RNA polymerase sigma-70 factor (ECF subfamily)
MGDPELENRGSEPGGVPETPVSDASLLRRFLHGQEEASTEIYQRYAKRLQALAASRTSRDLARRVDPEDIVQSVFRTFFRRAARGEYEVPDDEELWGLFLTIALNKVRALGVHHRAAKRDVRATRGGDALEDAIQAHPVGDEMALATLRMVIDEVLSASPPAHRRMVELRIEGYEVAEIARTVERSMRSVERVLQGFRQRLGALIREGD